MTAHPARRDIGELDAMISTLPAPDRERFYRIFSLCVTTGETVPPETMRSWLTASFGSVEAVRQQRVVKITNRVIQEGTLFNALRARRPLQAPAFVGAPESPGGIEQWLEEREGCQFCHPKSATPADLFGRVSGKHCTTAANVAKADGWHAVVVFDEHHPLRFTAGQVADYVDTAQEWARTAHRTDPAACYPFFLWNCLWRSGASIVHGHAQMLLTRDMHYARVEGWREATLRYQQQYGSDYFADLLAVHHALGLAVPYGSATILPSLTPSKERETLILARQLDADLKSALYHVLSTLVLQLGVQSFNLALYQPPLSPTAEDWSSFPFLFRILTRGSLQQVTSDVGALEFFAQSVVVSDPFRLTDALRLTPEEEIR